MSRSWLLWLSLAASGCVDHSIGKVDPHPSREEWQIVPALARRNFDVLFVVDNSGSMADEQTSLGDDFQRFIDVFEGTRGGLPDLHLGVVSSNVGDGEHGVEGCGGDGDDGRLLGGADCGVAGTFITDAAGEGDSRTRNYGGSLQETFACMAALGTAGCGLEQHLESMRRALDGRNPGFLRDDAYLAVVFVADEDDCSAVDTELFDPRDSALGPMTLRCAEYGLLCDGRRIARQPGAYENCAPDTDSPYVADPHAYVDFLKGLKENPHDVLVAGIVGDADGFSVRTNPEHGYLEPAPSCSSPSGEAAPGISFASFLDGFEDRSAKVSICQPDLSGALQKIAELMAYVLEKHCLSATIDLADHRPDRPGLQPECAFSDVQYRDGAPVAESIIYSCPLAEGAGGELVPDRSLLPCWWLEPDDSCSADSSGLAIHIERDRTPPDGTDVVIRCAGK